MINRSTLTRVCPLDTPDLELFSGGYHGSESDVDDLEDEPKLLSGLIAQRPRGWSTPGRPGWSGGRGAEGAQVAVVSGSASAVAARPAAETSEPFGPVVESVRW